MILMNGTDRDYFDTKLNQIDRKLQQVHDDVLVLKTQRDLATRFGYIIAGAISLVVSVVIGTFWK